jgi:hypothetical protein
VKIHFLSRGLDVRDTRQLVAPLAQLRWLSRLPVVVRTRFSVSLGSDKLFDEWLKSLWPVTVALGVFEQPFLELQFLLGSRGDRGVACVDDETRVLTLGRDVVVRSSRIPYCE